VETQAVWDFYDWIYEFPPPDILKVYIN